jgi:peptidoglycan/xylan/chitin deacetylase (PgdA/CDA1 family)
MRHQLKSEGLMAARRLGVFAALRFVRRRQAVVLAYHGVLTRSRAASAYLDYNFIPADVFDLQIAHLKQHYHPISLSEFVASRAAGRQLPPRAVLVTFDDGFANNWRVAYPILRAHGVPFAVFLATGLIGADAQLWSERASRAVYLSDRSRVSIDLRGRRRQFDLSTPQLREQASRAIVAFLKRLDPAGRERHLASIEQAFGRRALSVAERERYDFLTWNDVREMARAGVEFGSHTVTHPILSTLDMATLERELVDSKQQIEDQLGIPCPTFAYPNGGAGDFGPREQRAVRDAGYRCAFALLGGLVGGTADPYALERVNIGRDFNEPMVEAAAAGVLGWGSKIRRVVTRSSRRLPDPAAPEVEYVL